MKKAVVISDYNKIKFEEKIEKLLNDKYIGNIISISFNFDRQSGFYEPIIYDALIVYEEK